jgi:hypothetical protein
VSIIYPTHRCFDDALDFVTERMKEDPKGLENKLLVVHGIVLMPSGPDEGEPYAHAWVEEGSLVWQGGILDGERVYWSVEWSEFRDELRVQEATRYTLRQAYMENQRTNHYGPWLAKYEALCRGTTARQLANSNMDAEPKRGTG